MLKTIVMLALAVVGTTAEAATLTYNVNQNVGLGSVIGTIETDGAFGALSQSDITAFNLTVSAPGASIVLTQADSVVVTQASNLSATNTNLFFDFSGPSGFLLFQQGSFGTGKQYYCNASVFDTCFQGASAIPESFDSPSAQIEPRIGNQAIASIAGPVPEPASWALMVGGFAMIGGALRRTAQRPPLQA